ncbi:hypothetical protein GGE07_004021 [Sinorhizobium terangae]|uniref:Uncharacterized protein n=1 Tax=Sinorhizobium terangae TaxID=110322 RepID=A0A6N7LCI0_SINTE|nr:hypothetical protein [Sinorhizobium terangae]MBB4187357.1 hypothetical protein [Sinorhizobium terangae]MQX14635.1 hypothetical protein [Sinorhizobium terangae]
MSSSDAPTAGGADYTVYSLNAGDATVYGTIFNDTGIAFQIGDPSDSYLGVQKLTVGETGLIESLNGIAVCFNSYADVRNHGEVPGHQGLLIGRTGTQNLGISTVHNAGVIYAGS